MSDATKYSWKAERKTVRQLAGEGDGRQTATGCVFRWRRYDPRCCAASTLVGGAALDRCRRLPAKARRCFIIALRSAALSYSHHRGKSYGQFWT